MGYRTIKTSMKSIMIKGGSFPFNRLLKFLLITTILSGVVFPVWSQTVDHEAIKRLIQDFKRDERGPYQAIRWFCPDGTILPPKERCPEPGGIQHALAKEAVQKLAAQYKIYLGQILAGSDFSQFFDSANLNLRLQQYQMEKFLQAVDNGWIMRRARYYRGAVQAEDEENWGQEFLKWLVAQDAVLTEQFFLLRQVVKDIPHQVNEDKWLNIRGLSKTISDSIPSFMDLRVKLHGQPEFQDISRIEEYYLKNQTKLPKNIQTMLQILLADLQSVYRNSDIPALQAYLNAIPVASPVNQHLKVLIESYKKYSQDSSLSDIDIIHIIQDMCDLLFKIREHLVLIQKPEQRLVLMDLSNNLESILFQKIGEWQPQSIGELLEKNYTVTKSLTGCGFLEVWEWHSIESIISPKKSSTRMEFNQIAESVAYSRRVVEWSTAMVRAIYDPVINLFSRFEPLAVGFIDDQIRSSLLLAQGQVASQLAEILAVKSGTTHQVMGVANQSQIRGINPGYATGELVVVTGEVDQVSFSAQKIYLLQRAPVDMKPVAGIATVSEGNLVSHVQLLARNLGIPNAVISEQNLYDLLPHSGKKVFYAVSPGGTVVLKLESNMTVEERALIEERKRSEERINVPTTKLNLNQEDLLNLKNVRAKDSGSICGPKAANLGQLKSLFPDKVVNGVLIPFGVFKKHLEQPMPNTGNSYWMFLQNTFVEASNLRSTGKSEEVIETRILSRFAELRDAIKTITFLPGFQERLKAQFLEIFDNDIGQVPVFIRSDTNMEDLKEFTGAGLNLTVFNVLEPEKIFQGIRDVWASPYAERSYRWRQKYLLNPENVYPSILIIPTVRVDKSGVLITTGIISSNPEDLTIAFNRGAGGAVEGQMAESYLLKKNGLDMLISPSRERGYTVLPESGGTLKRYTHFNHNILNSKNLEKIRLLSKELQGKLKGKSGINASGPYDVELGFVDNDVWLFQVRPYVESKKARSSQYLQSLDAVIKYKDSILLQEKI